MKSLRCNCNREIFTWWDGKVRELGCLPGRQHFEPSEFRRYLPHVFLVDVLPGPEFRYRLHGGYIVELWGSNFTGKCVGEETYGRHWPAIHDVYVHVVTRRLPTATRQRVRHLNGFDVEVEVVHLPLARDGRTVDMVLGTLERCDSKLSPGHVAVADEPLEWTIVHPDDAMRAAAGPA